MDDNKTDKGNEISSSNDNNTCTKKEVFKETEDIQNYFNNIEIPKELSFSVKEGIEKGKKEKQYQIREAKTEEEQKNRQEQQAEKKHKEYKHKEYKHYKNLKIACSFALLVTVSIVACKFGTNLYNKDNLKDPLNDKVALVENKKDELKLPNIKNEAEFKEFLSFRMNQGEKKQSVTDGETKSDTRGIQSSDNFSKTNTQIDEVEEGDLAKTDGNYIYSVKNSEDFSKNVAGVGIVKAQDPKSMFFVSQLSIKGEVQELYITKNKLIIISQNYVDSTKTSLYIYNKEDVNNLKLERKLEYDAFKLSTRMIGNKLVMVLNKQPYLADNEVDIKQALPKYYDSLEDREIVAKVQDIKYCPGTVRQSIITIASIDVENSKEIIKTENILASSNNIYCSQNNLYISGSAQLNHVGIKEDAIKETLDTSIYKFSLNQADIKLVATGKVKGIPLNQFSMDEKDEKFRITTTDGFGGDSANNLYILDRDLKEVGKLENLASKERIYSVRFMGSTAYMVTFKQVDPLFVIDMEDEKNPKVKGELKIPGFSNYLHPLDKDTLIGFGEDIGEDGRERKGLKLSLFDVSDETSPKETFTVKVGSSKSFSELSYDHKAFFIHKEKAIIGIPINNAKKDGKNSNSIYLAKVTKEEGFKNLGEINLKSDNYLNKVRIMYIGETLYIISSEGIVSYDMNDLKYLGEIKY